MDEASEVASQMVFDDDQSQRNATIRVNPDGSGHGDDDDQHPTDPDEQLRID